MFYYTCPSIAAYKNEMITCLKVFSSKYCFGQSMGNRVTKEIKTFFRLTTFTYKEKTHVTKNWPMLNF